MTVTVVDNTGLVESVRTGKIPVPEGIAEDNARQAAKREPKGERPESKEPPKPLAHGADDPDDLEGEDGITPRQKREFTKAMLATIAKKHRAQREAEELATSEYNRGRMAEERAEGLAQELARLKAEAKPAVATPEAPTIPKRADFENDDAYQEALIDYRVEQKLAKQQAEAAERAEKERQEQVIAQARQRIATAIELVPDFVEVTESVTTPVPAVVAGYLQESELFAELGYHFAKHPEVLERLSSLTPARALVEVGKIESMLRPFAAVDTGAKVENGVEPSRKNGAEPSAETGSSPSKPRSPVIRPLVEASAAQVEKPEEEMRSRELITSWQKKHGVQLLARKRH